MAEEKNPHAGHRQRMLKKYLEHGITAFEEYELLEIFLYFVFSRRNTTDISRELIDRFGSLRGVLDASYDDLMGVGNIGSTGAALITFLKDFAKKYESEDFTGIKLDDSSALRSFCFDLFGRLPRECVHALYLDQRMNLIGEMELDGEMVDSVELDMRQIISRAIKTQCSNIVLSHNHPGGVLLPSSSDIAATRKIAVSLNDIGITLVDHIIVNEEATYSMRIAGMLPDIWNA